MFFRPRFKGFPRIFKWYLVMFCSVIVLAGCAARQSHVAKAPADSGYALIIDAGSSGSRIYIYAVGSGADAEMPEFKLLGSEKVKPGISGYDLDPEQAKKNLAALVEAAKSIIDPSKRKNTPLYVLSTAGMRLLNDGQREAILKKVADFLVEDGTFDFKTAMVISGAYEGLYAWLAANYLDDRFDPMKKREGIMEMGGASTQIAFTPSSAFSKHKIRRVLRGKVYDVFTRSWLYMGANEARDLAASANCYPPGFPTDDTGVKGVGGFDRCAEDIRDTFGSLCENLECGGPHCVFKQDPPPALEGKFFALSSFYFTFKFLGMDTTVDLPTLLRKGRKFCSKNWKEFDGDSKKNPYLKYYCFNSAYFWDLLKHGYRMPEDRVTITPKNDFRGWGEINWTLGALIDISLGHAPMPYQPGEPFEK